MRRQVPGGINETKGRKHMSDMHDMKTLVDKTERYVGQQTETVFIAKVDGEEAVRYEGDAALFAIEKGDEEGATISGVAGKLSVAAIGGLLLSTAKAACSAAEAANGAVGRLLIATAMRGWANEVLYEGRAEPKESESDGQ